MSNSTTASEHSDLSIDEAGTPPDITQLPARELSAREMLAADELTTELIEGVRTGTQVVAHDGFDVAAYRAARSDFKRLAQAERRTESQLATGAALVMDLFNSFHKRAPQIAPPVPLLPSHEINREIVAQVANTVEWRELREMGTVTDAVMSSLATIGTAERITDALDEGTREGIKRLTEVEAALRRLYDEAAALAKAEGQSAAAVRRLVQRAKRARTKGELALKEATELVNGLSGQIENAGAALRRAGRAGIQSAQEEVDAAASALKAFGGGYDAGFSQGGMGGGGGGRSSGTAEKIKLAERVRGNEKLKRIAEMCGRLTRIALAIQKSKVSHPPDEIASITTGIDIGHMLANEAALLADPDTEDLFYLKFAERRLTQYELIHNEPQGRGPILCAVDESGSMSGESDVWAKSVVLALMAVARLQKRDMVVVHFGSSDQLKVERFERGCATPLETVECADHFFSGGTDFEPFMEEIARIITEHRYKKADAIIITDGLAAIGQDALAAWQTARTRAEMRAYGVLIGSESGAKQLAEITDAMMTIEDLREDRAVLDTIFNV